MSLIMGDKFRLRSEGRYTINKKALKRWSKERLQLTFFDDGNISADFHYDGTTCSNFGHPLAYRYQVTLSSPATNFTIQEMSCVVAEGDMGHQKMCEFLKDGDRLVQQIEQEQPLLGKPLNEVLDWQRPFAPDGCYCKLESRMHKWGAVLETIHFALAHRVDAMNHGSTD